MTSIRVLKPGGRLVRPDRVRAGTSVKAVMLRNEDTESRVGTMTEQVDRIDSLGVPAIRRITELESATLGDQRTLAVVHAESLHPLAYEAHLPTMDVSARYQGNRVTGIRKQGNQTQIAGGLEIPGDVFDIGSIELLLRAVELSAGWAGILNLADPVGARVTRGRLEVRGEEVAEGVDCWSVTSIVDGSKVDYLVAKDGDSIVRQSFSPRPGVTIEFVGA